MIFKVVGVLQLILIQEISAQLSTRDLASQNVLNNLVNTPLVGYGRTVRQINNPPCGVPGNGNMPANGLANGLPLKNNMPNGNFFRGNGLPNNFALNNGLPNSSPHKCAFPNANVMSQNRLLPSFNDIINDGLPGFNDVPKALPGFNNGPNGLPLFNNGEPSGLPGLNNAPNSLPSFNNVPSDLPGLNNAPNGLPSFNNVPSEFPSINNIPSALPSFNNGWPSVINVPNELPNLNNRPNGLPNLYNNPTFTNKVLNLNKIPAGSNILNLNNLPARNTLSDSNNMPIPNGLSCGNIFPPLPVSKGLPLNNLPSGNILTPINNQLPYLNNFRITEIGIGNGVADINRFPRDNQPVDNMPFNGMAQVSDGLTNANKYQNGNGFLGTANMPSASSLATIVPIDNKFSTISSGISNIASEVQINSYMDFKNGRPEVSHFQNYNAIPVNEQQFVNNVPFNNDLAITKKIPANTGMLNTNSRLVNAINNGMPLSNGGHLNDILFGKSGSPEVYTQHCDGNIEVPDNNWHFNFVPAQMPTNQNLPEGVQMFSNMPSEYSSVLTSNKLNLAQELVKNLQFDGLTNMPFLNGFPVAGITETVTVLNSPYSK